MENLSACNRQQDSDDEANDPGNKKRKCVSDEKSKSASPLGDSDLGLDSVLYSEDYSDSDDSSVFHFKGQILPVSMETLYTRNSQQDPDNSDETAFLKAKRNNDSEITAALLMEKLLSAFEDENEDIVETRLEEFRNTSDIFLKSLNSESHSIRQERIFEFWRDAMYIAMEKNTRLSEEMLAFLLDCDIIWSIEAKVEDLLLQRIIRYEDKVDDRNLRLIEMLLKFGKVNVNARDENGCTALHYADEENLTSLLIHYGADVNKKAEEGKTPLMPTSMWGKSVSVLQTILKEARTFVDLDAFDCNGHTALMIATIGNQPDVVELLLNAGASVNLSDHLGFTALHHALFTRFDHYDHFPRNYEELKTRKDIFTILLDAKDDRCDWYIENKEWFAMKIEIIEMLLGKQDTDVNTLSLENFSPFDIAEAAIPQLPSSIKTALKEKGAVLNVFRQAEPQSSSRFHLDARCRLALKRLLCNVCAEDEEDLPIDLFRKRLLSLIDAFQDQIVSGKDQHGRTALHLVAISFSIIWSVWVFVAYMDENNNNVRDLANTIVKELITIGCNVNETDVFGRTPLHYADKILKNLLISYGGNESIEDNDGNSAIDKILPESTNSSDIVEAVVGRNDEIYFLRFINDREMGIEVHCVDSEDRAYADREFWLKTVPRLLWEKGEYAFRHPLVDEITTEVTDLIKTIAKEIERLDPRFEIKSEFVGSSNEGTKINKPDEFDVCFVLTKISELCEVFQSPELPTGFVRMKRKPIKVDETSDFDSFFGKDGILNTEKINLQFSTILRSALLNIDSQQNLDYNLELTAREFSDEVKKVSNITMIKPTNIASGDHISIDIVPCIHVDGWWPHEAISNVSDDRKNSVCNLIFESPQKLYPWVPYSEFCARISFSKAESDMIKHSCVNAREAYMIGKTMIDCSKCHCGYILKNCLLYCIDALTPTSEKAFQLGLGLEELESKFHQMDRYLWLKCLMRCHLEFVMQDFCPFYFLPNSCSAIGIDNLKGYSLDWMKDVDEEIIFPKLCRKAYAFIAALQMILLSLVTSRLRPILSGNVMIEIS